MFIYQRGHRGELSFSSEGWLMGNVFFVECTLGSRGPRELESWGAGVLRCRGAEKFGSWGVGESRFSIFLYVCLPACLSSYLSVSLSTYWCNYLSISRPLPIHPLPGRFWHLMEIIQRTWGGHFGVARIRHALEAKGHEPQKYRSLLSVSDQVCFQSFKRWAKISKEDSGVHRSPNIAWKILEMD